MFVLNCVLEHHVLMTVNIEFIKNKASEAFDFPVLLILCSGI